MKKMMMLAAFAASLLLGASSARADEKKELKDSITISQEALVNETKLKPGTYEAAYNAETNEISIRKGDKVLATAKASARGGETPVRKTEVYLSSTSKGLALTKLVFKGDNRAILIENGKGGAPAGQ